MSFLLTWEFKSSYAMWAREAMLRSGVVVSLHSCLRLLVCTGQISTWHLKVLHLELVQLNFLALLFSLFLHISIPDSDQEES